MRRRQGSLSREKAVNIFTEGIKFGARLEDREWTACRMMHPEKRSISDGRVQPTYETSLCHAKNVCRRYRNTYDYLKKWSILTLK
ncbi:hypothetical protein PoB_001132800 [Plakobranchus ocellatus]|uniref:Uncharacterized protein n=1 Tax=Plakobranchus ocellatus TaxID=259542 RepID=A0AAV3YR48_9GAST|nr:hypothetical protein PoB_001132800 [Plakobranchus ocellatus]